MSRTYSITYCANYKIVSSGPKRLLRTQKNLEEESNHSSKKIYSASFFRYYRKGQNPKNSLERWAKNCDIYCASNNVISIGPKISLETNISKKGYLPGEKKFLAHFFLVSSSILANLRKHFIGAQKVFWQVLCKW